MPPSTGQCKGKSEFNPTTINSSFYSGSFEVPPGTLAFSVTLFSICAVICLIVLYLRRVLPSLGGAELGGPTKIKTASFGILLSLWFGYVLLSALQTYGIIAGF